MFTVRHALKVVDQLAPFAVAEEWDNVGLQIGAATAPVRRIAVALETTPAVVRSVARRRVDLLIVHHPLIFKSVRSLTRDTATGALALDLIRAGVAVIAAHTNLDASPHGTNAALAQWLQLTEIAPLFDVPLAPAPLKLAVYVPEGHEQSVIQAIARGGGGRIGPYDHCSFRVAGTGTYRPLPGARPFAGKVGRLASVAECRIEAEAPPSAVGGVLRAVRAVHPYEEMAYDLYPRQRIEAGCAMGLTGLLPQATTLSALAAHIRRSLPGAGATAFVGKPSRPVRRVAIFTGAGRSAVERWRGQADALVTGEIDHHTAREAEARGMAVIAAGHYATERPVAAFFAKRLRRSPELRQHCVQVIALTGVELPMTGA